FYFLCLQTPTITGGEDGIQAIPRGHLFGAIDLNEMNAMYAFVAVIFAIGFYIIYRTIQSPFGHLLEPIPHHDPPATPPPHRPSSATAPTTTSSSPSCCRRRCPASPAPPRRWSTSSPPTPTSAGTCPAWSSS